MAKVYCDHSREYIAIVNPSPEGFLCPKKGPDCEASVNCRIQGYVACQVFLNSQRTENKRVGVSRLELVPAC